MSEKRKVEMILEYQNYIETPPIKPAAMWGTACSSDAVTIESWRQIWINQVKENHKRFGNFKDHSIGQIFNCNKNKPAIIVGSGPSIGYNGEHLAENKDIMTFSCLHNYHFFEDRGINIDYYVTLDAGEVIMSEVAEGGQKTPDEYWESTKNKKLCAFVGSPPALFDKWKGEVFLFASPVPDPKYIEETEKLEPFYAFVSTGGNVLGACQYIAKAICGSNPIAFVGADFSFGYNTGKGHQFHSWDSKYDGKIGNVIRGVDVFGNKVLTWPSYSNFKYFFDFIISQVPGLWVNCTEGGMLGAYPDGNLMNCRQMTLKQFIYMFQLNEPLRECMTDPTKKTNVVLF